MATSVQQIASNAWNYVAGQCTAFVASVATWIPSGLGNANTWVERAQAQGFQISQVPVAGSVAQFAGPGFSQFGHVAYVTAVDPDKKGFTVREMNFQCGPFCEDTRHATMNGVVGFILPPGSIPPPQNLLASTIPGVALLQAFPGVTHTADLKDLFIRAGLIILGLILVVVGILITFRAERAVPVAATVASRGAIR